MKIFIFLALIFPMASHAVGTVVTATVGAPIPVSYSASDAKSKVLECPGNTVKVFNYSDSVIGIGFSTSGDAPISDYAYVPSGPSSVHVLRPRGVMSPGIYLYIRSPAAAETSESVYVSCTTED